jgi:undecaprenyl diphosphate synthase
MRAVAQVAAQGLVPRHIAIIMDGNGRWAAKRFLPRAAGHRKGVEAVRKIVQAVLKQGVEYLTLFAFSSENWQRPVDEVSMLLGLFISLLESEVAQMQTNGIRLRVVGDLSRFDSRIQDLAQRAEQETAHNCRLTLTIAANYGGRWDIVQAAHKLVSQRVAQAVQAHEGSSDFQFDETLSEAQFAQHLALSYAPDPDLFIRTSGEQRISNFLLWQLAYTELYFTEQCWPDFDEATLEQAIVWYRQRERRYGRTGEQVAAVARGAVAATSVPC